MSSPVPHVSAFVGFWSRIMVAIAIVIMSESDGAEDVCVYFIILNLI